MSIFKYEPLTDEEYENEILKNDAILKNDDIDDYKMNIEEPNLEIKQPNTIKNEKIPNPSNEIEPEDHKVNSEDQKPFKYKCTLCDFKTQYSWNLKNMNCVIPKLKPNIAKDAKSVCQPVNLTCMLAL